MPTRRKFGWSTRGKRRVGGGCSRPGTIAAMARVTVSDVLDGIGRRAPWAKAADWDPVGLQLGDPARSIERVAVCHEITESVVAALEADPPGLVVSYHPLLFRPTRRVVAGRDPAGRAFRLLEAGVAVAVAHTNFDVAPGGTADRLAESLGITDPVGFGPVEAADSVKVVTFLPEASVDQVADAMARAGAGHIGNYHSCSFRAPGTGTFVPESWAHPAAGVAGQLNREAEVRLEMVASRAAESAVVGALVDFHPYEEPAYDVIPRRGNAGMVGRIGRPPGGTNLRSFAKLAAERLGGEVRLSWTSADFNRVAVVPGSGADFIDAAVAAGAAALVTGDVSHHQARRAVDLGLGILDPGHARTERPGVTQLLELVAEMAPHVVDLTAIDPSPWEAVE